MVLFWIKFVRCIIYNFAWKVFGPCLQRLQAWQAIKIRGKLLIYNVRKGQHVSVPLKLFDSNFQLSLFFSVSSISLLFQFLMVAFDILFFFPCKKKTLQNCSSTRKRRFENVWICREILSGNFKWNFPVLWGEVSCNRCSTYTIVQFSVYPDLHPKIRRNFLRRGTSWLQIKRWETGKNIVSGS